MRLLDGWPVFHYVLNIAHMSGLFDRIILALDGEYSELVNRYMPVGTTKYIRDKKNSRNESPLIDLVREVVDFYSIKDRSMCILYSTSVLTTEWQLKQAYKILHEGKYKCVFPIVSQEIELKTCIDMPHTYCINWQKEYGDKHADSFFMFDIKTVLESGSIIQPESGYIELKDYEVQAVHTEEDFKDLEYKWRAMNGEVHRP